MKVRQTFRLYGINAPEMRTPRGPDAKDFLLRQIMERPITIQSLISRKGKQKRGSFHRYLAIIFQAGINVNDLMVESGHAKRAKY